jgi:hypothetical protein
METATIEQIDERLRELPPEKLAVVLDFVSFLAERRALPEGMETALLSEPSLHKDWDTPEEDAAWSHL